MIFSHLNHKKGTFVAWHQSLCPMEGQIRYFYFSLMLSVNTTIFNVAVSDEFKFTWPVRETLLRVHEEISSAVESQVLKMLSFLPEREPSFCGGTRFSRVVKDGGPVLHMQRGWNREMITP